MIVELGHVALLIAFALAVIQSVVPVWGAYIGDRKMMASADSSAMGIFVFTGLSFCALMWAYLQSDFSVVNVWQNSHSDMPTLFKVTGTWGNHEGSMLLWVLILALFAAAVSVLGGNLPEKLRANVQGVQAWMLATFLAFIIWTSNPFERQPTAIEGQDLNPILQDIGLAIHPPMLYLGYVGFSITFAFAIAALLEGRIDAAWARWVRPWALIAWVFLTAGIAMGSYWAYYELGWGGWWFWDPVENASFLPWLSGTALLHSALVMEKRDALKIWTVLLAILTFSLSLLGTFLVRSGVLTSVHTFASDPSRGLVILAILAVFVGGSLALFAVRANKLEAGGLFAPVSREGALVLNNILLSTAAATVLLGTLYPVVYEAITGAKISVGAPFFNLTFIPLMIPLILALPFGPLLAWKKGDILGAAQRLVFAAVVGILAMVLVLGFTRGGSILAPVMIAIAVWLMVGSFAELAQRASFRTAGWSTGLRRLAGTPRSVYATAFAHFGVGVTMLGIVVVTAYETETVTALKPGETVEAGGYTLRHDGYVDEQGSNFQSQGARLTVFLDGEVVAEAFPTKRFYPARQMPTSEASIHTFGFSQLYFALGDLQPGGAVTLRIWWKPYVTLIWYGAVIMSFGGLLSLTGRRKRLAKKAAKPSPNAVPAT
ncbi:heme lyase CcmF/NrfE family subunit [Ahrensia sp. R2A130]|uniref:heme lyase CcmF/NrfE family subunit n=1 Tax=Ahrensia sp. R2A130 TaxID=744979 RepID=UPI0001E0E8D2|nr:heme lyase CcmF/NrfE family subunit [Ahrensia sp. R2A130]EFL88976.1 cytochrome c-type biogenesis protein CcmF [Ahrensia sp. R2A130]